MISYKYSIANNSVILECSLRRNLQTQAISFLHEI